MRDERIGIRVRVWGDLACFTRPEFKVDRVSYPVMTPSAARGVLDAIFRKPEMCWVIERIAIPSGRPRSIALPVREWVKPPTLKNWSNPNAALAATQGASGGLGNPPRRMAALADIEYVIEARARLTPRGVAGRETDHPDNSPIKYHKMFNKTAARGACLVRPCLGLRQFAAEFALADALPSGDWSEDLGWMLHSIIYRDDGPNEAVFFEARIENGIIETDPALVLRDRPETLKAVLGC